MSNDLTTTHSGRVIEIPDFAMVLLVGASGSGKSTFARTHFRATEVLSSDAFRGWVADDENSLDATDDAFDALHYIAAVRLRRRRLVVIDATNVQPSSRKPLLELAKQHDALVVAIVLNLQERLCHERNADRPDRQFGPHVVRNQSRALRQSLRDIRREGFRYVYILSSPDEIESVRIERAPVWTDRSNEHGPFDIIGDIHGCYEELIELLIKLGYSSQSAEPDFVPLLGANSFAGQPPRDITGSAAPQTHTLLRAHPEGRRAIFLGDLVDRGPGVVETVRLVQAMVAAGTAFCVPGNHDMKLMRALQGKNVQVKHGLGESLAQIEALAEEEREAFKRDYIAFADSLVSHYLLDDGKIVVAHAGMKEAYQGRASGRVREFALFGETTGETDEFGLPIRYPWAEDYRGKAMVVYGHTPVPEAEWLNRTINIDTGCVFGGKLTALRYPERELVSVPAKRQYAEPARPFLPEPYSSTSTRTSTSRIGAAQYALDATDVLGKRIISTRLAGNVMVRAENSAAAFEVMSRFAVDPRWLIYLPPTMSPSETTTEPGYLEYPTEAFAYFRSQGVKQVVCQTKHMGSRAVVVICKDQQTAELRFGMPELPNHPITQSPYRGICYTRTGRRLFEDSTVEQAFIEEIGRAIARAGLFEELETDWLCLDAELMPWNAKGQGLLREQYAPVGSAAKIAIAQARAAVDSAISRGIDLGDLAVTLVNREQAVDRYVEACGRYCWHVAGLTGVKLAPFQLLAGAGKTLFDWDHNWHVEMIARIAEHSEIIMPTESRTVQLDDPESEGEATSWWVEYTESGGEGMVVKPLAVIARGAKGLIQPAIKVRGREYLRIIYGPEYTEPRHLERLRQRALFAKRSLAIKEFAMGIEGLERFVQREPLRAVHECAFAVLALESEPVDPRL